MALKDRYAPVFRALKNQGLNFEIRWDDQGLRIGPLVLSSTSIARMEELKSHEGVLLGPSKESLRTLLKSKNIGYIDINGNAFLPMPRHQIVIEKALKKKKRDARTSLKTDILNPSNLISPNSVAFVEAVLRTGTHELQNYRSVLHFCQTLRLYQPKASQIMTKINSKTLEDLKTKLKHMPLHWWKYALESPITKRKLTAFYTISQNYYSLDNDHDLDSRLNDMIKKYPLELAKGPLDIATTHGLLVDQTLELWMTAGISPILKKAFRLIPGQRDGHRTWRLATPAIPLSKEALFSHVSTNHELNILRAIWDMGFGDLRIREARDQLLERILHEA